MEFGNIDVNAVKIFGQNPGQILLRHGYEGRA